MGTHTSKEGTMSLTIVTCERCKQEVELIDYRSHECRWIPTPVEMEQLAKQKGKKL